MRSLATLLPIAVLFLFASNALPDDHRSLFIEGWGAVHDPDGDCDVRVGKGRLTITVPSTPHDMNPDRGTINAPRVTREITGDFKVRVRVTGDFKPGKDSTNPRSAPFNGAGLLLWIDAKNYVRLERNVWLRPVAKRNCFPPLFQVFQDGVDQRTNPPQTTEEFFTGESTWLKLQRRSGVITASYSHDGQEWTVAKSTELELPEKVQVGVSASNTSNRPFRVEFGEFKLRTQEKRGYR